MLNFLKPKNCKIKSSDKKNYKNLEKANIFGCCSDPGAFILSCFGMPLVTGKIISSQKNSLFFVFHFLFFLARLKLIILPAAYKVLFELSLKRGRET